MYYSVYTCLPVCWFCFCKMIIEDEPVEEEGRRDDDDDDDDEDGYGDAPAQVPYEPKAPERSPAPAVFKAWRQENYGTMMMQVQHIICTYMLRLPGPCSPLVVSINTHVRRRAYYTHP